MGQPHAHANSYARADAHRDGYDIADSYADADRDGYPYAAANTHRCGYPYGYGDRDSCAAACAGYPDAGHSDAYANTYGCRRMRRRA